MFLGALQDLDRGEVWAVWDQVAWKRDFSRRFVDISICIYIYVFIYFFLWLQSRMLYSGYPVCSIQGHVRLLLVFRQVAFHRENSSGLHGMLA